MGGVMTEDFNIDPKSTEATKSDQPRPDEPVGFLRQTVAPAVAMVILYASILSLPSLLVSQTPPINGEHLLGVFIVSLIVFYFYGRYTNRKAKRKEGPTP
jgi:hypothetical protein